MWHEARRSEKKVHDMMDVAKKRAERKALFMARRRGDPNQSLRIVGSKCKMHYDVPLYQATEEQQSLIPWNGKEENLIDRFDGRALLDFIREYDATRRPPRERSEEEQELEERANYERFRDLVKQRRRRLTDEEGLEAVEQELEERATAPLPGDKRTPTAPGPLAGKGAYAKVAFAYGGGSDPADEGADSDDSGDEDDEDDEEEVSSADSEDEEIVNIGQEYGVEDFNRMIFLERRAKEEAQQQKQVAHGDPTVKRLSRKERRKAARQAKDQPPGWEAAQRALSKFAPSPVPPPSRERRGSPSYDPYPRPRRPVSKSNSRSPSRSPSPSRRWRGGRERERDREGERERSRKRRDGDGTRAPIIEFITEFGAPLEDSEFSALPSRTGEERRMPTSIAPPASPPRRPLGADAAASHSRPAPGGQILEALRSDPAAAAAPTLPPGIDRERKAALSSSAAAVAKLAKGPTASAGASGAAKGQVAERKETPQERLKRIMSKQLSKQIKKDSVVEGAKKRDQLDSRHRLEVTRRHGYSSRARSRSPSPPSRSRTPPRRRHSRSRSRSPYRSRSKSYRRGSPSSPSAN